MRIPFISLIAGAALSLGGCAYGDLGYGLGYGYGDYGYGYGPYGTYGSPYFGASYGYGSPYYGGYYGSPFFGWYDNFYYPGTGYYVYDIYRRPHVWSDTQRVYWTSRRQATASTSTTVRVPTTPNWSAFNRRTSSYSDRVAVRTAREQSREQARQQRIYNRTH